MTKLGNAGDFRDLKLEDPVRIFHGISYVGADLQNAIRVGVMLEKHVIIEVFSRARDFQTWSTSGAQVNQNQYAKNSP